MNAYLGISEGPRPKKPSVAGRAAAYSFETAVATSIVTECRIRPSEGKDIAKFSVCVSRKNVRSVQWV